MEKIKTDLIIIGAGPCGLFTVFEAGLLKLKCHVVDSLPIVGGQLAEIYPKKPIYDIPGFPKILAMDLVNNLLEQIKPFHAGFTLGERVESLSKNEKGNFEITTRNKTIIEGPIVVIAGGLGCFEPRKPEVENLELYEEKGVDYIIKEPNKYLGKHVVIAGGGDSALDWCIYLADIAASVVLIHRRSEFRGAPESVDKVYQLMADQKIKLILEAEVKSLHGKDKLKEIAVECKEKTFTLAADYFIPLFGLTPKLGPIAEWGLQLDKNSIPVNTEDFGTSSQGIYAVGDINSYPGKLKLILCGFHEAAMVVQSAYKLVHHGKKASFKYTTVTGIEDLA